MASSGRRPISLSMVPCVCNPKYVEYRGKLTPIYLMLVGGWDEDEAFKIANVFGQPPDAPEADEPIIVE